MSFKVSVPASKIPPVAFWPTAEIYFTTPQHLDRADQIQARGKVDFDGAWLHIKLNGHDGIITVPAAVVQRVEWSQEEPAAPNIY